MENNISRLLNEYGLDNNEINVFIYLVGKDKTTAYKIAKETKIHKSSCYDILNRLISKGFVSELENEKKKYYEANEISHVLGRVKNKESLLLSLMPEIQKLESIEKTSIKHVDVPGAYLEVDTKIYELYKRNKLSFVYLLGNSSSLTTESSKILVERLLHELAHKRGANKVDCKAMWDKKYRKDPFMKQFEVLGKNKFLEDLPSKVTTIIFDNHVAFLFLKEHDSFVEIADKELSNEMKAYFEIMWSQAKP